MMLDTFFIAVEAFDIITVQLPVVDIESRMKIKAIGSSGKALGIWNQSINRNRIKVIGQSMSGHVCV
jgi:hypothetical protein